MQNVVLTIHLILALFLTGAVLLQRSEGGGLGMGGGGGGGGVMTGRQAANIFTRLTWIFGIGLFITSISLTVIAARESSTGSIIDQLGGSSQTQQAPTTNLPGLGTYAPPPTTSGQPVTPPAPEAPASEAPTQQAPATPEDAAAPVTPPAAETPAPAAPAAETPAEPAQPATN
ncbi:preprotein translocase subunit SecG [Paracoccus sp. M683]|uniref:preprotein translocase subunit SecG n=1 Tax=Paracoccus sp. M683 TaxID=2594268 RepID=UPI00117F7C06|nr:preprotein translocase subunit SecG [Paracoccus sp. M683]TRW94831.1 preprotein translocase subunit SecG [Paracoccus sp. M683]